MYVLMRILNTGLKNTLVCGAICLEEDYVSVKCPVFSANANFSKQRTVSLKLQIKRTSDW